MHLKGRRAEKLAEAYLSKRKYIVHYRNKRLGRYEIDLVCEIEGTIVFVEVKSLSSRTIKNPYDSVNQLKQNKIIKVADAIMNGQFPDYECRFDIISIIMNNDIHDIEHIKNAFTPEINNG